MALVRLKMQLRQEADSLQLLKLLQIGIRKANT